MFSHQCMCFINYLSFQGFCVALAVLELALNSGWPRVHRGSPASASRVLWFLNPSFLVFSISGVTHSIYQGVGWRCLWTWWPGSSQGLSVSAVRNVSHHTWLSTGCWDANSDCHVCAARSLPRATSSALNFLFLGC